MVNQAPNEVVTEGRSADAHRPKRYGFLRFAAGVFEALAALAVMAGIAAVLILLKNRPANVDDLTYVFMFIASVLGGAIGGVTNFALCEICRAHLRVVKECAALRSIVSELENGVHTLRAQGTGRRELGECKE